MSVESAGRDPHARPTPGLAAVTRTLAIGAGAVVLVGLGMLWVARDTLGARGQRYLLIERQVIPRIAAWSEVVEPPARRKAVLWGDSVVSWAGVDLGTSIAAELRERGVDTDLLTVAHPAFRAIHFYYLLDDVLAARPRIGVVQVNPAAFSPGWTAQSDRYRNLSRKLGPGRVPAVHDALAAEGVTLLDPFLYRLEDRLGLLYVVEGLRAWWFDELTRLGDALNAALPIASGPTVGRVLARMSRSDAFTVRARYGGDLAADPQAGVLREMLRRLRAADVTPLLYVTPVNVERLAALGVRDALDLERGIERLRQAVGATPDEWLDLHALLPATDFHDATEHLHPDASRRVAAAVADAVARVDAGRRAP